MRIFIATAYSSKVDYTTGEVFADYKIWLKRVINTIVNAGHTPFCALMADNFKINSEKPNEAFGLDLNELNECDVVLALLSDHVSAGVQTEIGIGIALGKQIILAHDVYTQLGYFNSSIISHGSAQELILPISATKLTQALS